MTNLVLDETMSANIDRQKTLERFGYDPFYLSHQSGLEVVRVCPKCKTEKVLRKQVANKHEWCIQCRGRERNKQFSDMRRIYANPAERKRMNGKRYSAKKYATPVGHAILALRSNLRSILNKKQWGTKVGCFRHLGYTPIELGQHIEKCFQDGCCICHLPIDDKWHLTHLKPRSFAKSVEEVYELYQLNNLAVAHPECNIRVGTQDLTQI